MKKSFKVGDVVKFKSGSPKMTIDTIYTNEDGTEYAKCAWFDESRQSFRIVRLAFHEMTAADDN